MEKVLVRQATSKDAKRLIEIYRPYVLNTGISFEYVVPTLADFTSRIVSTLERYPYYVAEVNGLVVGYGYTSAFKSRIAYQWSAEISIYVDEKYRGHGIGKLLYGKLEEISKLQNITNLNACITGDNNESIAFHERCGYRKVAFFNKCGYKLGKWYDIVWMEKIIQEHKDKPENFIPFVEIKESVTFQS